MLAGFLLQFSGIGLSAWNSWMGAKQLEKEAEQLRAINQRQIAEQYFLHEQLKAKDQQIENKDQQINALIETANTVVNKTDASAKMKQQALEAMKQGNADQAKAILVDLLKTKEAEGKKANNEAAEAARSIGALAFMNDTKAALAAYRKATELDPDNADGWNQLAALFFRTGELAQAEEAWRKVLALGKTHKDREEQGWTYGNLGIVYAARGELDNAEDMFRKALVIDKILSHKKGMAAGYGNLGNIYYVRDELDKAEDMHKKALELNNFLGNKTGMAQNYGNLGLVHQTRGELDKAEDMYEKALALNKSLDRKEGIAIQYDNLGALYKQRGNLDQAEAAWKKSLRLYQEMNIPDAKKVQQWLDELAQKKAGTSR